LSADGKGSARLPPVAGLHLVEERDVEPLAKTAAARGVPCVRLDLHRCSTKADFLARLSGALGFRPHAARNWDALADSLGDLRKPGAPGLALFLSNADRLREASAEEFQTALEVLEAASAEWAARGSPLWVFLVEPGATPSPTGGAG
jgi:RNAse (barnase) inhibitor barstar